MAYPPEKSSPDSSTPPANAGSPTVSFKPTPVSSPGLDPRLDRLVVLGFVVLGLIGLADLVAVIVSVLR